jgi:Lrp/AsnC family transcriptional regulator
MVASFAIVGLNQYFYSQNCHKMKSMNRQMLDALDLKLLDILQQDGALSVADVAARARQSATTCWRRIQHLEQNGVIQKRVALLDRKALGLDVTILAHVKLATTGRDAIAMFEAFYLDYLSRIPCVQSVNSSVAVTVIKKSTALPLGL